MTNLDVFSFIYCLSSWHLLEIVHIKLKYDLTVKPEDCSEEETRVSLTAIAKQTFTFCSRKLRYGVQNVALFENLVMYIKKTWCIFEISRCILDEKSWCIFFNLVIYIRKLWCICNNDVKYDAIVFSKVRTIFIGKK